MEIRQRAFMIQAGRMAISVIDVADLIGMTPKVGRIKPVDKTAQIQVLRYNVLCMEERLEQ